MTDALNVLAITGSFHEKPITGVVVNRVTDLMRAEGCAVSVSDLGSTALPLLLVSGGGGQYQLPATRSIMPRATRLFFTQAFYVGQ